MADQEEKKEGTNNQNQELYENRDITTDAVDIKNVIREYYEQIYANTFEN